VISLETHYRAPVRELGGEHQGVLPGDPVCDKRPLAFVEFH
jgi:hypothetical protein